MEAETGGKELSWVEVESIIEKNPHWVSEWRVIKMVAETMGI